MRRFLATAVFAVIIVAVLTPSGWAQAPAPKVTITGLFEQITSMGRNFYDGNFARNSDREWYARTRFRPDFEFSVGRVKAVLGLEIDLQYGQAGSNDGGFPGNNTGLPGGQGLATGGAQGKTKGKPGLKPGGGGLIQGNGIYTEVPLTGKGSLLPVLPL